MTVIIFSDLIANANHLQQGGKTIMINIHSIKNNAYIFGKYIDQPALVHKLYDRMPVILTGIATGYGIYDTFKQSKENRKNKAIKNISVLGFTAASALLATRGLKIKGKQLFEGIIELPQKDSAGLKDLLSTNMPDNIKKLVQKVQQDNVLSLQEVKKIVKNLKTEKNNLVPKVIPDPESEAPFEDLVKLSWLGLIPVLGGITGGVTGDRLTNENWKKKFPDKVKEGTYQYLNNIALCNVGAGLGALSMNILKVKSKLARFCAMMSGVIIVGLIAGNTIANFIGKNVINPIFENSDNKKPKHLKDLFKNLNEERHPEMLDLSLHLDDVASVGFVAGLKWIGPILPMLYSVSAYRAGIGYRNGNKPEIQQ